MQDFPNKPIRLLAIGPGGSHDFASRLLAPKLSAALGQPAVVEYQASGFVPAEIALKSAPDGHTLLVSGRALWLMPLMQDNAPYDVLRDFAPISLTTRGPEVLVVRPDLPVKTAADLIALAKARPGVLKYASGGDGSNNHLAAELFKAMAGADITRVRFKSSSERLAALLTGDVQMYFTGLCSFAPQIKAGILKPLGLTTITRSPLSPELPTIAESGLPGYENITVGALFAPARTPPAIVSRLSDVTMGIMRSAEAKEYFFRDGYEAVGDSPQELVRMIKSDVQRVGKLIKDLGIRGGGD